MPSNFFDIIVVGAGHAGIEAAGAAARMGCRTLLVTLSLDKIGALSCNPAIGGVGKGQLVKEIDALGGLMAELADSACIQFRRLNTTRGAAVQSSRMQVDMEIYPRLARQRLEGIPGLALAEDEVVDIRVDQGRISGLVLVKMGEVAARAVVLTPGTFFHGLIHIGHTHFSGGRMGDPSSEVLPEKLAALGLRLGRFKTGTTPRLDGATIDFSKLHEQSGDPVFLPFSNRSPREPRLRQMACHIGRTNSETHRIIRDNLSRSALYSGIITGTGVRYCPSVEDKIVKFPDRESHHVFVEPEGLAPRPGERAVRYYPNGLSNSLPLEIQRDLVHSIEGLERAEIVQAGYGIEHDFVDPLQLRPTLEVKTVPGLYVAGQINGTTGYEEAAAQGLLAGINAACRVRGREAVVLDRSQAYIGVLIDDLVTKGTNEPYRMFTSRVEYRLVIREDNADERLTRLGHDLGLITEADYQAFLDKEEGILRERRRLRETRIHASPAAESLLAGKHTPMFRDAATLEELLRRPELTYAELGQIHPDTAAVPAGVAERVQVELKYEGYIRRQMAEIEKFRNLEKIRIPEEFRYQGLPGLSREIVEKLTRMQPANLGQASRISGVTPAAIAILMRALGRVGHA